MLDNAQSGFTYASLIALATLLSGYAPTATAAHNAAPEDGAEPVAEESTAPEGGLDEVVVTAQKRAERLQDVPTAITALSADQIASLGVTDATSLARVAPSLTFSTTGGGGTEPRLIMRGLSSGGAMAPVVSVYVDETPLDFRIGDTGGQAMIDFFDLERIEVLRGPQGTILGSSSLAGAIRIVTAKPDPTAGVSASTDFSTSTTDGGGTSYWAKGALNLPIGSNAAIRFVATRTKDAGWMDGVIPVTYTDIPAGLPITWRDENWSETTSARVAVAWSPTDTLTIRPSFIYNEIELGGLAEYKDDTGTYIKAHLTREGGTFKTGVGSLVIEKEFGAFTLTSASNFVFRRKRISQDFSEYAELFAPFAGLPSRAYEAPLPIVHDDDGYSQEIRATSAGAGRMRWIAGAYFNHSKGDEIQDWRSPAYAPAFGSDLLLYYRVPVVDEQIAGFGEATLSFFDDRLEVAAGARAYKISSELSVDFNGPFAGPDTPLTKSSSSGVSPRVSATFKPSPKASFYATYSEGFRQGGPNPGQAETDNPEEDCTFFSLYKTSFDPDTSKNYEIGAKAQPISGLSLNLAAYQLDWNNFQSTVSSSCGSFLANLGSARNRGVELETQVKLIDNFSVYGGVSFNDGKVTSVLPEVSDAGAIVPGQRLINTPKWQANLGAQADFPLRSSTQLYARANWQYSGKTPTIYTESSSEFTREAYSNVDAAVGYKTDTWNLELFGRNLFNEIQIQQISTGQVTLRNLVPGRPRTIGVNLRYWFD